MVYPMSNIEETVIPRRRVNPTIAANIRAELAYRDLSQSDLANYLQRPAMWLSRRMNGQPPFSSEDIAEIADCLGVDPGDLFRPKPPQRGRVARLIPKARHKDYSIGGLRPVAYIGGGHPHIHPAGNTQEEHNSRSLGVYPPKRLTTITTTQGEQA